MAIIKEVRDFWEKHPLFSGESKFQVGSYEFFEEHRKVCLKGNLINTASENLFFPRLQSGAKVLDLGCGIGFWTVEILKRRKLAALWAADLTQKAIDLTRKRLDFYGLNADLSLQNAEKMLYQDEFFDHVNCRGVIHHTPNTEAAVREIARVLKKGATAYISVYYKNIFLRLWPKISYIGRGLYKLGAGLKGRGRESIFLQRDPEKIVRLYDGESNPVGKCYTKDSITRIVEPYFKVEKTFLRYFPVRAFPFRCPGFLHRFLTENFGFLINLNLRKK